MGEPRPSSISLDRTYAPRKGSPGLNIATPAMNIVPSDGFSSPRDTAHTPPGVLTKIETKFYKTSAVIPAAYRLECANCGKKDTCLCKKCTLEKLKFYARKERLAKVQREKMALAEEVERILGESSSVAAETNTTLERIEMLKQKIIEKRQAIEDKKRLTKHVHREFTQHQLMSSKINAYFDKHEVNENFRKERIERRKEKLNKELNDLKTFRAQKCLMAMNIFPVREVVAEQAPSEPSTKWAMVSGTRALEEGNMFQVRGMCLSESSMEKLAVDISRSALELPAELRPTFAAFLHTFQLVNILAYIVNCRLPFNISLKELSLRERWTKSTLDQEWYKLCQCVLILGLRIGVNPDSLHFHYPHSNLIEIARHIYNGNLTESLMPIGVTGNHCEEIKNASAKINLGEREMQDWDIIDGEEEF